MPQHDHDHAQGHDHAHPHAPLGPEEGPPGYYAIMQEAVQALLIDKGVLSADEVRRAVEAMDARSPAAGARVVARAWCDPAFKGRLLSDGNAACRELGIDIGPTRLIVVENTAEAHNVIVCTLCSCYPRMLLGLPPDWYKSRAYRSRAVREPRALLAEFGTPIADSMAVRVHDSTADMRYLVLPRRPEGTAGLDEAALAAIVTRDCMIGVAVPDPGAAA
jgi:nitrile hydratase